MPNERTLLARRARAASANALLEVIAGCGRRFFRHPSNPNAPPIVRFAPRGFNVATFVVDDRGRVWFYDEFTERAIFTHNRRSRWRGFTGGGTMRALIEALADYVHRDVPIPSGHFGPWAPMLCGGDLWGYGADMARVRTAARALGLVTSPEHQEAGRA